MLLKSDTEFMELRQSDTPAFQVISKGAVVDETGGRCTYLIETYTLRSNNIMMSTWYTTEPLSYDEWSGATYEDVRRRNKEREDRRDALVRQMREDLGIDTDDRHCSFAVSHIVSELFAAAVIREIGGEEP